MKKGLSPAYRPAYRGAIFYTAFWGIMGIFEPFLNVYFSRLGFSGREIGLISAFFPLMVMIFAPTFSTLGDRNAWRVRILKFALVGVAVVLFFMNIPKTFRALLPLVALYGFFRSPIISIADSVVVRMCLRYDLNYGRLRQWGSLSFSVVAVACGALWDRVGMTAMFPIAGIVLVPGILAARGLEEGPKKEKQSQRPIREIWQDNGLIAILAATFLVEAAMFVTGVFGGVYMDSLGGGLWMVGLFFGLSALAEMPGMRYSEALRFRLGGPGALLFAYLLTAGGVVGQALAASPWILLASTVLRGAGFGLFFSATVCLIDERVPEEWSSTTQAIMQAGAWGLIPLIAAPLAGVVYDLAGGQALFWSGSLLVGLAILVIIFASARGYFKNVLQE